MNKQPLAKYRCIGLETWTILIYSIQSINCGNAVLGGSLVTPIFSRARPHGAIIDSYQFEFYGSRYFGFGNF